MYIDINFIVIIFIYRNVFALTKHILQMNWNQNIYDLFMKTKIFDIVIFSYRIVVFCQF